MMFESIEKFNQELLTFSFKNEDNIQILNYIKANMYDDIIFNVCNNLKDLLLNIKFPYAEKINNEEQYNLEKLKKYKESIRLVLTRFETTKEEVFNMSKIWFTRTQTNEDIKKSIQSKPSERLLTNSDLINWEYIKNNI